MPIRPGRRIAPLLSSLVTVAVLLGACSGGDATPLPSVSVPASPAATATTPTSTPGASGTADTPGATSAQDALEVYRAISAEIVKLRGLDLPKPADPQVIDAEQLRKNLEAEFDKSNPAAQILLGERIYKALGLLAADASLRALLLDFQGSQVIGYYDPSVDELFVVSRSGTVGPTERATYAHEFTHQLQDGRFDLESLGLEQIDEGDRALAVLGLVEGDAVSIQTSWMTANLTPAELGQIAAEAADPEILAVIGRTPAVLLETALFPYQAGAAFVNDLLAQGGYAAVNRAYVSPPASSEQVLHPAKFAAREPPVDVALPGDLATSIGSGWRLDAQDTLGELRLRIWLREGGVAGDVARLAAEGWGGDRVGLLAAPGGNGDLAVLVTEWDTAADATDFRDAATAAVAAYQQGGSVAMEGTVVAIGRRVVVAMGDAQPPSAGLRAILQAIAAG